MSIRRFHLMLLAALLSNHLSAPRSHAEPPASQPVTMPHVRVDLEQRHVDVDATVVLRESDWIELLACTPGSREHESILTVKGRPSHIHLALVMLGLDPGSPMTWRRTDDDRIEVTLPTGPRIEVSIVHEVDGQTRQSPASNWIIDRRTDSPPEDSTWLFAGSDFAQINGNRVYRADVGGSVVSLVNFGDDLLTRNERMTNHNDNEAWAANTAEVPPIGTDVILRLRPAGPERQTKP